MSQVWKISGVSTVSSMVDQVKAWLKQQDNKLTKLIDGSEPPHSSLRLRRAGLHWYLGRTSLSVWLWAGSYMLSVEPSWEEKNSHQSACGDSSLVWTPQYYLFRWKISCCWGSTMKHSPEWIIRETSQCKMSDNIWQMNRSSELISVESTLLWLLSIHSLPLKRV